MRAAETSLDLGRAALAATNGRGVDVVLDIVGGTYLNGNLKCLAPDGRLVIIGAMMMTGATKVDWTDYRKSIPAFLAIVGMPFTYSITFGISLALVAHTVLMAISGKIREIHPVLWILTVLIVANETGFIGTLFGG